MTTKFYLNQPVKSDMFGYGVVTAVLSGDQAIYARFGTNLGTFTPDGRRAAGHPVDLHPVEKNKEETKFYVGQRVKDVRDNDEGIVVRTDKPGDYPIVVDFIASKDITYTLDGIQCKGLKTSLFPIEQPKPVLTEWQEKKLRMLLAPLAKYVPQADIEAAIGRINTILSSPEPPKYQPKQGEAVLVRDSKDCIWLARVSNGYGYNVFTESSEASWFYCIPFDADKVGKVTED